jgi:hypothetical protein
MRNKEIMTKKGSMGLVMAGVLLLGAQAWAADTAAPKSFKGALAKYDTNKDKKLSQDELSGSGLDFASMDTNKDGSVDAKEWRAAHRSARKASHAHHNGAE